MSIEDVVDIIGRIAAGFEAACARCLAENSDVVISCIKEQMLSGLDGEENHLTPTYDNDPYFDEAGFWYHRAKDYKAWKRSISPQVSGAVLGLPPRPDDVPNLYITGVFYSEITAAPNGYGLDIDPGNGNGPAIVAKYGDCLLDIGPTAIGYFNANFMLPAIESFFRDCGYR